MFYFDKKTQLLIKEISTMGKEIAEGIKKQREMEKYYQPDISEFHVGFEYEYNGKCIFTNDMSIAFIDYLISKGKIRVKYLDKEDIESIEINGEKFIHDFNLDSEEHPSLFNEHGYSKGYALDTQLKDDKLILLYHFPDGYVVIDLVYNCGSSPHSFSGIINNKSELKRILKQTGV